MNKWNNEELKSSKMISDEILGHNGSVYLTLNAASIRYSSSLYDYTPDIENSIDVIFTEGATNFVIPINGWMISNPKNTTISPSKIFLNDIKIASSSTTSQPSLQMLIGGGDKISIDTTPFVFTFYPCLSEQYDYKTENTPYDIWNGAIIKEEGQLKLINLWIPKVTGWYENTSPKNTIISVINEKAYSTSNASENSFVCNIQTSEIVTGGSNSKRMGLFYNGSIGGNIEKFDSNLSKLIYGDYMFYDCSSLSEFSSSLDALEYGTHMFTKCSNLTIFDENVDKLKSAFEMFKDCTSLNNFSSSLDVLEDGTNMFNNCSNLLAFDKNMSKLKTGVGMFKDCTSLNNFSSSLDVLEDGTNMFGNCSNLTIFDENMTKLKTGIEMFKDCSSLNNFSSSLDVLEDGTNMFSNCCGLSKFDINVPKLRLGNNMFSGCSNLSQFESNLSYLRNGKGMFSGCKLTAESVINILSSLSSSAYDYISITMEDEAVEEICSYMKLMGDITIPAYDSGEYYSKTYKSWTVELTCQTGVSISIDVPIDVTEENGYIPDASGWNEVYQNYGLTIKRVINGVAYDE